MTMLAELRRCRHRRRHPYRHPHGLHARLPRRQISVITIPADPEGCRTLLAWARRGTSGPAAGLGGGGNSRSHGLGLTRVLQAEGQLVVEAGRPARASKRPGGKSDPADALQAARNALAAEHHAQPRADGAREALRILLAARAQASTARTAAVNSLKALLLGAPAGLRAGSLRAGPPLGRSANAAPCGSRSSQQISRGLLSARSCASLARPHLQPGPRAARQQAEEL